jgi:hypothetical protein
VAKGQVSFCHHLASVVVCHELSHLNLLLWNPWTKLNQTWQGWSLGGSLSKLCLTDPPSFNQFLPIMQIRHILIKDHIYKSFLLKPLNQITPNLKGMVLGWVPFKIVSDSPALHSRWLLLLKIKISSIVHCCFSIPKWAQILTAATWQWVV